MTFYDFHGFSMAIGVDWVKPAACRRELLSLRIVAAPRPEAARKGALPGGPESGLRLALLQAPLGGPPPRRPLDPCEEELVLRRGLVGVRLQRPCSTRLEGPWCLVAGKVLFGGVDVKHLSSGAAVRVVTGHMRGATACEAVGRGRWEPRAARRLCGLCGAGHCSTGSHHGGR